MWPILLGMLRRNAVYLTLPVAAVVGVIGYNLEGLLSDRYTPYSASIQEKRVERLALDQINSDVNTIDNLRYGESVLERNLPPSLQKK